MRLLVPGGKGGGCGSVGKAVRYGLDNITFQQLLQQSLLGVLPLSMPGHSSA